jgi:hypothetical protein
VSIDRDTLARYLRQRLEMGDRELFLETLTAPELLAALSGPPSAATVVAEAPAPPAYAERKPAAAAVRERPALPLVEAGPLGELGREAAGCTRCRLHQGRRTVVFGEGDPNADVVVVGEAPGFEEDRTGRSGARASCSTSCSRASACRGTRSTSATC